MSDWQELYQQVIVDHGRSPRNFGQCAHANHQQQGVNPLCGDKLTMYLRVEADQVVDVSFEGSGCAISMASASLLTEAIKGRSVADAQALFKAFHQQVTEPDGDSAEVLGKLMVLTGVVEYPMRVKCATLAWHTMMAALGDQAKPVSTE